MLSYGFPPIVGANVRVLILGSLPGRASMAAARYYANPQNAFWRIFRQLHPGLPDDYGQRAQFAVNLGIGIWDVLAAATRSGSLDADIGADAIPNNFRALFQIHPTVGLIGFNGATAAKLYRRHVLPGLDDSQRTIKQHILPSTSAAHASMSFAAKVAEWSSALAPRTT